jgi:hypothetical protein
MKADNIPSRFIHNLGLDVSRQLFSRSFTLDAEKQPRILLAVDTTLSRKCLFVEIT